MILGNKNKTISVSAWSNHLLLYVCVRCLLDHFLYLLKIYRQCSKKAMLDFRWYQSSHPNQILTHYTKQLHWEITPL